MSASKEKDFDNSSAIESGYYSTEVSKSNFNSSNDIEPDNDVKIDEEKETEIEDSGFINSENIKQILDFVPNYLKEKSTVRSTVNDSILDRIFQQDDEGYTSLHKAILSDAHSSFIDKVLSITPGSSYLNIKNDFGITPLHLAIILQQYDTIHKLIDAGADLNTRTCSGKNSLHLAVLNDDTKSAEIILSAKSLDNKLLVSLDSWNLEGETCFYVASKNQNLELMELLRDKGADINAREGLKGYTSLHLAVEKRNMEVINFLLNSKAQLDVENYAGLTSFQLCLHNDNEPLADLLMNKGAIPFYTRDDEDVDDDDEEMSSDGSCY